MADIDLSSITEPLSEDQPCGPDLDMEFDGDFMNFEANVGMAWPERYFSWDADTLKGHTYYDQIEELLSRSRDLRLLVPLAKLRILEGNLAGFAEVLEAIQALLKAHWADVHPQPADFLELGMGQLATLDDNASSVLPFMHTRLVASRRSGPITYRKWLVATGDVNPREEEDRYDAGTLTAAIAEASGDEVDAALESLQKARDAIAGIRLVCIEEAGYENAPAIDNLPKAVEGAIAMLESATGKSDSAASAAEDGDDPAGAGAAAAGGSASVVVQLPAGAVENREAAIDAMHAAAKYFALYEPSSPAPMLLREAQNAASKSFFELVNDMVPDTAASAFVTLGREPWFEVSLSMLDQRNPAPDYDSDEPAEEEYSSSWENAGLEDEVMSDNDRPAENDQPADESGNDEAASGNDGLGESESADADVANDEPVENDAPAENDAPVENDAPAEEEGEKEWVSSWGESEETAEAEEEVADEAEPEPEVEDDGPRFVANSRPEAIDLMNKVLTYYRVAEPSSPVSLIIERALELASKNFIELLGDVLPDGSLKVKEVDDSSSSSSGW
ncbi:MAG: type VI secretion system ImpA family N-terminal domain-containing protein [Pseudomonadota bacterium]